MKLGLDLYSIRSQGWDAMRMLDYCHQLGVNVAHFGLGELGTTDAEELGRIKARADALGLEIELGMGSICETSPSFNPDRGGTAVERTRQALDVAHRLGSRVLKCLLGGAADRRTETPLEVHIANCVATCRAVREQAMDLGIKLAVENHAGDLQGWELRGLIEEAGPDYVGACLDTGNSVWVAEDPMVTFEHLAPYIVTSHLRDSVVWAHPRGAAYQWVAMGDGNVGMPTVADRFKALGDQATFTLEILTGAPPRVLNYLETAYWTAFPNARAAEFARFERLVRQGQPFIGTMVMVAADADAPAEYEAARIAQQRYDVERSVRYCREMLGIGE
jgi:3-oxoisoapionate decarboxylase